MSTATALPTTRTQGHRRWLFLAAVVLTALYVAVPVVMALDLDAVRATVQAKSPNLDTHGLDVAVIAVVTYSAVLHAISVTLLLWFTVKTLQGRRWARIALTVFLIAVTAGSFASWSAGLQFQWTVVATDALHVTMLRLLWLKVLEAGLTGSSPDSEGPCRRQQTSLTLVGTLDALRRASVAVHGPVIRKRVERHGNRPSSLHPDAGKPVPDAVRQGARQPLVAPDPRRHDGRRDRSKA